MGRKPLDAIPQHQLVAEMRRAIDIARLVNVRTVTYERAVAKILQLCRDNPNATLRAHVLHNLGCTRRIWLYQLSASVARDALVWDTNGVQVSMRSHLEKMGCSDHEEGIQMIPARSAST